MLTTLDIIKNQIKESHEILEKTVADIKDEHWHKDPGGLAHTLASAYAHAVFSEDGINHGMLQGKAPLYKTAWSNKTGASEPMPEMDEHWHENHGTWVKTVKLDLEQFKKYTQAVYEATTAYLETVTEPMLEEMVDLGSMGQYTRAHILTNIIASHNHNLAGEISAIKGVFGVKGYPF